MGERMKVDKDLIQEISSIMKLEFSEEETKELTEETNKTLSMLKALSEVDTEGVEGIFYGRVNGQARFRKDEAISNEEEVEALLEATPTPTSVDHLIEVPAILDDGEGGA